MSALEWLDTVRADLDEATPGPWEAGSFPDAPWDPAHSFVEIGEHEVRLDWLDGSALDARLIASAPDRLDRMERALRAVLERHRPRPNTVSALYPHPLCECGLEWGNDGCPTVTTIKEELSDE